MPIVSLLHVASLHNDFNILYLFFISVSIAAWLCKRTRLNIVNGIFALYTYILRFSKSEYSKVQTQTAVTLCMFTVCCKYSYVYFKNKVRKIYILLYAWRLWKLPTWCKCLIFRLFYKRKIVAFSGYVFSVY